MPTLANQLVQFLMGLFNNPAAAEEFLNDPERSLEDAGLREVCSADVDAAMPVVLDYAPISVNASSFDREYNTGGNTSWTGGNGGAGHTPPPGGGGAGHTPPPAGGGHHDHDDHAHAVQQLNHVVNNYSYTSTVDDRDTVTDQSVNQNIWADGDVNQWFDNEAVIASGDQALAAGDDNNVRDSYNTSDSYNTDNTTDNSTDNSITAGGNVNIGNSQLDVDDSFNTDVDVDVADSFNDNSDNSMDNSVQIEDSFQDNSDNSDNSTNTDVAVEIEDSFQDNSSVDSSTNTDVAVDLADSFNDNSQTETTEVEVVDSFNPVEVEDSFQDNSDNSTNTDLDVETDVAVEDSTIVL
ncbi:IniB N-terminal domain-containing protein [Pseudarthrobacter sp. S3]|uniref:IniB N-terminal domain-containing protein n=1 Tax=Pseudarthrobacter sp. S3 TaxID=3418419 RepID=UPI003CE8B1C5